MPDPAWTLGYGFLLGLSLAAPPGPILALAAQRTVEEGFWPGVSVPLGATTGDGTHALLMGLGILPLLVQFPRVLSAVNVAGAILLFLFAWYALQGARSGVPEKVEAEHPPSHLVARGFGTGYVLALTSPYNFGWWFGVGTALFQDFGPLLFVGFFAALVSFSVLFVALTRWARDRVAGIVTVINYGSAVVLVAFGVLVLYRALPGLA